MRRYGGGIIGWPIAAAIALTAAPPAGAAISSTPDNTVVTNGPVNAIARTTDGIYIGGGFDQVGPRTGPWVALSAADGHADAAMPQVSGGNAEVDAIASDGSGGFYIGGNFTHVGGLVRHNAAHILANKTVDPAWDPNTNNTVRAIAVSGSTIYLGGDFTSINGSTARNRAAAVDASTGLAKTWDPNVKSTVLALAVSGTKVYLGGVFNGANAVNGSTTRNYAAAVDATSGAVDATWDPKPNGAVRALTVGLVVYMGGNFTTINDPAVTRRHVAAVSAADGSDFGWDANVKDDVRALALSGTKLYIGGIFEGTNAINGNTTRNHAAAVSAVNGTVDSSWNPNVNDTVQALAISGSTVYLGGFFKGANSVNGNLTRNRLAAVDATNGNATSWNPNSNAFVSALAVSSSGNVVSAGGNFSSLGGQTRNHAAALDPATGALKSWNPNINDNVSALAVSGSTVYLGGQFSGTNSVNGNATRNHAAAVDAATGQVKSWNPNLSGNVLALAVSESTVYLGGFFTGANSVNGNATRNHAAAVDASTGAVKGWNPNLKDNVFALAVSPSTVYLGGDFQGEDAINGAVTRSRAAAVDATTGLAQGWTPTFNQSVLALAVDGGGGVVVGGFFSSLDEVPQQGIAVFSAAPANLKRPRITGNPTPGAKLTCARGTWAGSPPLSFTFRWLRGGALIAGATTSTYKVKPGDLGKLISCRVTAKNRKGSATKMSAAVKIIRCVVPKLKGKKLGAARKALTAAHCKLGKVKKKKHKGKVGRVLSQKPKAGKRLPAGSKVAVVVSKH